MLETLCSDARRALLIHENSKLSQLTMNVQVINPSLFLSVKMYLISFMRSGATIGKPIAFRDKEMLNNFIDMLNANYTKSVHLIPVFENDYIA